MASSRGSDSAPRRSAATIRTASRFRSERAVVGPALSAPRRICALDPEVLPAGVSPSGTKVRPALNPRQRLERPLSLTTRLRERPDGLPSRGQEPCCQLGPSSRTVTRSTRSPGSSVQPASYKGGTSVGEPTSGSGQRAVPAGPLVTRPTRPNLGSTGLLRRREGHPYLLRSPSERSLAAARRAEGSGGYVSDEPSPGLRRVTTAGGGNCTCP